MRIGRAGIVVLMIAATVAILRADVFSDLGTTEAEAKQQALQAVTNGSIPYFGVTAFKAATAAKRTALVQAVLTWAKGYFSTPEFKSHYDTVRAEERPGGGKSSVQGTYAEQLKKQLAEIDKQEAELDKNPSLTPELRKTMKQTFESMKEQIKAMANNPDQMKMMEQAMSQAKAAEEAENKEAIEKYEREHPADPKPAIAARIKQFMSACADVDFDAKLVPGPDGKKHFANPAYESKPSEWKQCFRAGREPVTAARTIGQAWLKELGL